MSGMSVFIGLILVAIAVYAVTAPLRGRAGAHPRPQRQPQRRATDAADAYQDTLLALRDLDFDHRLGVVTDDDYGRLREELMGRAAELMPRGKGKHRKAPRAKVERHQRATRRTAARPTDEPDSVARCPQCGRPYQQDHRFCGSCGTRLSAA